MISPSLPWRRGQVSRPSADLRLWLGGRRPGLPASSGFCHRSWATEVIPEVLRPGSPRPRPGRQRPPRLRPRRSLLPGRPPGLHKGRGSPRRPARCFPRISLAVPPSELRWRPVSQMTCGAGPGHVASGRLAPDRGRVTQLLFGVIAEHLPELDDFAQRHEREAESRTKGFMSALRLGCCGEVAVRPRAAAEAASQPPCWSCGVRTLARARRDTPRLSALGCPEVRHQAADGRLIRRVRCTRGRCPGW